jgi:hypothetical protein
MSQVATRIKLVVRSEDKNTGIEIRRRTLQRLKCRGAKSEDRALIPDHW